MNVLTLKQLRNEDLQQFRNRVMELISVVAGERESIFAQFETVEEAEVFAEAVKLVVADAIINQKRPDEEQTILDDCFELIEAIYSICYESMLSDMKELRRAIQYADFNEQRSWADNLQMNVLMGNLISIFQQE